MLETHFWKKPTPESESKETQSASARERYAKRIAELKAEAAKSELQPEERLAAVLTVRSVIQQMCDLKRLAQAAKGAERERYLQKYAALREKIEKIRQTPEAAAVELAWREYIRAKSKYHRFKDVRAEIVKLEKQSRALYLEISKTAETIDVRRGISKKRDEAVMRRLRATARRVQREPAAIEKVDPQIFQEIFGDEARQAAQEYEQSLTEESPPELPATLAEVEARLAALQKEALDLWQDPMVRYFYSEETRERARQELLEGKDVLGLPSTERIMDTMRRHEEENPDSLFGSVLIGPPGTGKTTAVREYCARTGRRLVEIDLSGDVTRYLFWGTREIVPEDPAARYEEIKKRIGDLHGQTLIEFLKQGVEQYGPGFLGITEQVGDELKNIDETTAARFKEDLLAVLKQRFNEELASEVYKYGRENGWRAGLLMHALRRGDAILFNEFNKAKDLSFLHGLLTARAAPDSAAGQEPAQERPGWFYVADAKQWVRLPTITTEDGLEVAATKFFFTANVGKKYKVQTVLGPLASRAEGKVIEVEYPPKDEEMMLMNILVEDGAGKPILDQNSNRKLVWLIGEVFPKIRAFIEDKPNAVELSFRTLRNLAAKLIDRKTERPRKGASVDRAVKEVLIDTYALYGDKAIPRQIITDLLTHKVITEPTVIAELIERGYVGAQEVDAVLHPTPSSS